MVLARRYLYFLAQAQVLAGVSVTTWATTASGVASPGTEDGWGCSLWALGTAAARGPTTGIREESFTRFCRGALVSSPSAHARHSRRSGRPKYLTPTPATTPHFALLYRAHVAIGNPGADAAWPWPVPRLSYANAAIAEAVHSVRTPPWR